VYITGLIGQICNLWHAQKAKKLILPVMVISVIALMKLNNGWLNKASIQKKKKN
jgi:hypothetical protein